MSSWKDTLVEPQTPIRDVLLGMGKHRKQIALVIDSAGRLLGTVTDGDVRRSILRDIPATSPISAIMNEAPICATPTTDRTEKVGLMKEVAINHLPLLDEQGHVVGLDFIQDILEPEAAYKPNTVVLLAGGRGKRLRPMTNNTPKPLLRLGGRPILETIVVQLHDHGFRNFYMSINHLADQFKEHFGDGSGLGVKIKYIEEDEPLGTAGPLGLISDPPAEPMIVMNGDILTNINFSSLLSFHEQHESAITVATREIDIEIPYGVLNLADEKVVSIDEKPTHKFIVSAGIYVVEPSLLASIRPNTRLEMPEFIQQTAAKGKRLSGFPIYEYWLDIGRIEEFNQATGDIHQVIE